MTAKVQESGKSSEPLRVVLFYEHAARELPAAHLLQSYSSLYNVCIEVYQIYFEWVEAYSAALRNGVDVVIIPWCYTKEELKFVLPFRRINPNLTIINMHQEQIAPEWMKAMLLPKDSASRNGVFHFCWASYFFDELMTAGVKESLIYITGNTRLQVMNRSACTRRFLAEEFGLDESKRWILFAETKRVDKTTIAKSKDFLVERNGLPYDKWIAVQERTKKTLDLFIKQVAELPSAFFNEYEFIYRPHPGSNIDYDLGSKAKVIDTHSISDWLGNIDVFCTDQSTSAFEAEIASLPVIIHECIHVPEDERMPGVCDYHHVQNIQEIDDESISVASKLQESECIYERYVGLAADDAIMENFFKALEIASHTPNENIPYKHRISWIAHFALFEIITKVLYRTKLIRRLRWPRTAYMLFNDIPY